VIVVVALNPALDVTHHLDAVDWAGVNRPASVSALPGGKGLNVARTLRRLGADVLLLGLAGGSTGAAVRTGLAAAGVPAIFTDTEAESRRTFAVVDAQRGTVALFNEPGPPVSAAEFARLRASFADALAGGCSAVVLSGSLPAGLPDDSYAELIESARRAGVPALLDTSGAALLAGASAGPAVVKPNLAELAAAVGREVPWRGAGDPRPVLAAAAELRDRGPAAVVVSLGADGLLALTSEGAWLASGPPVAGNPTGAGDAVTAALSHGLELGRAWPERLRHAAALGAATAAAPVAGEYRRADYERALAEVTVTRLEAC
jgi:tagatose 6-phosphate kinase